MSPQGGAMIAIKLPAAQVLLFSVVFAAPAAPQQNSGGSSSGSFRKYPY